MGKRKARIDSNNSSSRVGTPESLARIPASEAERFWVELTNLQDTPQAAERLQAKFRHILDHWGLVIAKKVTIQNRAAEGFSIDEPLPHEIYTQRETARRIWRESDVRTKDFCIERLRHKSLIARNPLLMEPWVAGLQLPTLTPFEQCLYFLSKWADRTRLCAYWDCPTPYFLAKRRVQKYCTEKCAAAGDKEIKRRWWNEHGEEWRAKWKKRPSGKTRSGHGVRWTRRGGRPPRKQAR